MASDPRRAPAGPDASSGAPRRAASAETYLPLVRRIAMKLARSLPSNIAIDDIISAGWVGLSESLKRCPPGMSDSDFEAYASYRVRGAILDYLRTLDPLTRKLRTASRRISQAIGDLAQALGRVPEEDEVAGALGVTLDAYRDLLREIGEAGFARLDIDMVDASSAEPSPEANVMKRDLAARVTEAIQQLPERLQLVLALHYQEECTLKDIGAVLGVTESRACQLHSEAVQHIRALVERPNLPRLAKNGARRRPTAV